LPKRLSERMMGEEVCFCYFLFDLEGLGPLPTYPQVGSKSSSSLFKSYLVGWVDFEVFENGFKKRKETSKA